MLSYLKKRKTQIFLISSAALIITAATYCYVQYTANNGFKPPLTQDTEVTRNGGIKITPDTVLVQKIVYLKCHDVETLRTKPADNLIGLNYAQLQKVYSGWTIDKFDPPEVQMTLEVDSFCREHANNMFIGIKDGYVAVFYGKPGPKAIVKEVTKISANKLTDQDLDELRRGMIVKSKEDLLRTLEGLQSR
ncbi:Hypothetical protein LUCI_1273 [Lucifera butyrica]|uniref:Bypass of forespore C C-terminal domain-containing protein n=1 Tax=Lucifera butyrica TaxID=1351585 RepID=A0A498R715_9FIRM|nr:BofC C-terminal domain-containing protein [Lucifera butyrica]VBB06062.1 Hypothetical protein LUCI_1273 [Lucifera butyrica]